MSKLITAAALSLCLSALSFDLASAQASPAASAPAKATLSTQSLVGDLMADPDAKAILAADIPEVVANPQLKMGYGMTLREIRQFEPTLTDEILAKIDQHLAEMRAKRGR